MAWPELTPEVIASAIAGIMFALSGIGVYARTKGSDAPRIEGAYKIGTEWEQVGVQLERIAQGIEDLVAANKDSFQRDMRDRFEKLEEIMEHQAQEREARGEPARRR